MSQLDLKQSAELLLRKMLGTEDGFRDGQWEAIQAVVENRERVLVVQRTGWGKSMVYFLATRLLRDRGAGLTLLISPLLSLMRNQIEMAKRIGIKAITINSANRDEWDTLEPQIIKGECDILMISPERLNNERFIQDVLPAIQGRIGLFVVDEAHCISDWGHDFRPDYRRVARVLDRLPKNVPVLATTATANDRVLADVKTQLGKGVRVLRGALQRDTLRLQTIVLSDQSERLAWLAENIKQLPGSGIVYCLTVNDTERVAQWLKQNQIDAEAYSAEVDNEQRVILEEQLIQNRIKVLVATVALGMGFDKPDLGFVIHFQRPGSVIAYYQQVGRAGRAINEAYGVLLSGTEDDDIQNYFIETAFPSPKVMGEIVKELERSGEIGISKLLNKINTPSGMAEKALKLLELEGAVGKDGSKYFRTPNPWQIDLKRIEQVTAQRHVEAQQMRDYLTHRGCLMEFLAKALDDPQAAPCGKCANCLGVGLKVTTTDSLVARAVEFLKHSELKIEPRKIFPQDMFAKTRIPVEFQNKEGRSLCSYGDAGWGKWVRDGKYQHGRFDDQVVSAAAQMIRERWKPAPFPKWVTAIPSKRHPTLVYDLAQRLAEQLGLPFVPTLERVGDPPEQKTMENSAMQARNVNGSMKILPAFVRADSVLLVDDIIDSGWTLTMAGYLLKTNGSGVVFPFTLARATARNS